MTTIDHSPDAVTLSEAQSLRWHGSGKTGRVMVAVAVPETVAEPVLRARLQEAGEAHEILRAEPRRRPELREPYLEIAPHAEVAWTVLTQEESPEAALEAAGRHLAGAAATGLSGILVPVPGCAVLVLSAPSLLADPLSLLALSRALVQGPPDPDASIQYFDYVAWKAQTADGSTVVRAGGPPDPVGEAVLITVPNVRDRLARASQALAADPADVLLTGWLTLLHRHADAPVTTDVLVDGRDLEDLADVIGPLEAALPLGLPLPAGIGVAAAVSAVSAALRRVRRGDGPSAAVSSEPGPPTTAFRVLPDVGPAPVLAVSDTGLGHALVLTYLSGEVVLQCDTGRLPAATDLAEQLSVLLEHLSSGPDQTLDELDLLDDEGRRRVLALGRGEPLAVDSTPAPVLFQTWVQRTPDAPAVLYESERMTFAELDHQAARIANALIRSGVRDNIPVALFLPRGTAAIAAVLGTWRAGSAYLPVDGDAPPDRIASVLVAAGVRHAITTSVMAARLPDGITALRVDDPDLDARPTEMPPTAENLDGLAYLIATSGTTGEPRMVAVTHRSLAYLRSALRQRLGRDDSHQRRVAVNGPLAFDTSVKQLIQILDGHTLCPIPAELRLDPARLAEYLREHRIDTIDATPSQLALWLDAGLSVPHPATLLIGGEPVPEPMWRRLADSGWRAVNLYGPTECTVDATACDITSGSQRPSLGRPLPGTAVQVLDGGGRLLPPDVPGELAVTGPGVAAGYHGDATATALVFDEDPHGEGARRYRTGDRARLRRDGTIDYLGRLDRQVKIRGCRVEPAEIEAVLGAVTGVRGVAVVPTTADGGAVRLVAYVAADPAHFDPAALRARAAGRLPDYMVPSVYLRLERLPLNRNGKLDVRALPDPATAEARRSIGGPARTDTERVLAGIWCEVLGLAEIGREDNFFGLGGDSLRCIQVTALARGRGVLLAPMAIFQHQTVAALAASARAGAPKPETVTAATVGPDQPAPLLPIQHRFFERRLTPAQQWNQSALYELRRHVEVEVLQQALADVVNQHEALRLRFPVGAERTQTVNTAQPDGLLWIGEPGDEGLAAQAQRSLDIAEGPLLRAVLLRSRSGAADRLLVVVHHLAVDGVSWEILQQDLETALAARAVRSAPRLPTPVTGYRAWATALSARTEQGAFAAETAYWAQQHLRRPSVLPAVDPLESSAEVLCTLTPEETRVLLREVSPRLGAGTQELLLAAVLLTIREWSGAEEIVVDLEGHGRLGELGGADLTRTVGWFTAVHPVRFDLDSAPGYGGVLEATRAALRAVPNGGVGYGALRYLAEEPALAADHAQISFNYLGHADQGYGVTDAMLRPVDGDVGPERAPDAPRKYLFEFDASVVEDQLRLYLSYGAESHQPATVLALTHRVRDLLRELIAAPATFTMGPSPVQEAMARAARTTPRYGQYLYQWVLELGQALERPAWDRAWQDVLAHHEALRTSMPSWPAGAERLIADAVAYRVTELDWSAVPTEGLPQAQDEYLAGIQARGLDLGRAPALEIAVAALPSGLDRVYATFSLAVLDVPSFATVLDQVLARYADHRAHRPPRALPPSPPYADYVAWGRTDVAVAADRWRGYLAGAQQPIPADPDRSRRRGYAVLETELSAALSEQFRAFSRSRRLTGSSLLQCAWARTLAAHHGRADVLFGAIVSGHPPTWGTDARPVGRFVTFLPVRIVVPADPTDRAWMSRHQGSFAEMLSAPQVSPAQIQEWTGRAGPLFTSLVGWEPEPLDRVLDEPDWAPVTRMDIVEDPDIPVKLSITAYQQLKVTLSHLPDEVGPDEAAALLRSVLADLDILTRETT